MMGHYTYEGPVGQLATTYEIVPPFFKHKSHGTEMVRGTCPMIVAIIFDNSHIKTILVIVGSGVSFQ